MRQRASPGRPRTQAAALLLPLLLLLILRAPPSAAAAAAAAAPNATAFSTYFANWAVYHEGGFSYTADDLAAVAPKLGAVMYAFLYFCPPPGTSPLPYWAQPPYGSCTDATAFEIMSVEPRDAAFLATLATYKAANPGLKVLLSVGGWNFPSEYFSKLAASPAARGAFAASAKAWLASSGADGIDLDWESPCSAPREDDVEISCGSFQRVADAGGSCPQDTANIVLLYQELRAALGPGATLALAAQAGKRLEEKEGIAKVFPILDRFNIMTYDYAVSDVAALPPGSGMSPNAPLFQPRQPGAVNMSIASTVANYLALGVPPSKIHVGVPLYAHTWFNASLAAGGRWRAFGALPDVQGLCCGPFASTFGGRPGAAALECGTLMYSEVLAAGADLSYYDNETETAIAYFSKAGADGTPAGTWVSYNDERSVRTIARWARQKGLGGVFVFDSSMDTRSAAGEWTYTLMNAIAEELA